MPSLSLTNPTALTVITAGLHSTNYSAIQSLLNGSLANDNLAPGAAIAPTKLAVPGNTTTFLRGDGTFATVVPTIGTTLPASPADGDTAILVDSLTAPTYAWTFRYVAGISDAYKWVFIGGSYAVNIQGGSVTVTSASYGFYSGVCAQVTIPRTGIYDVKVGIYVDSSAGAQQFYSSYAGNGLAVADYFGATNGGATGGNNITLMRQWRHTFTSSGVLSQYLRSVDGTGILAAYGSLEVLPVRVS